MEVLGSFMRVEASLGGMEVLTRHRDWAAEPRDDRLDRRESDKSVMDASALGLWPSETGPGEV